MYTCLLRYYYFSLEEAVQRLKNYLQYDIFGAV